MAKKKLRYSRRRKRRNGNGNKDNHHIFFTKRKWQKGIYAKLRSHHYCIIMIPKNTLHRYIHQNMNEIPLPSVAIANEALKQLAMLDSAGVLHDEDAIEKRLRVLAALFDCAAQATANALYKQLDLVYRFYDEPP